MRDAPNASVWWGLLVVAACGGSKKSEPEALPATIKYEVSFSNAPESRHGPLKYALKLGDKELALSDERYPKTTIELPSSVSITKQSAAILVKGTCKTATLPTTGEYLPGNVTDDASERAYLAKESKAGKAVSVFFHAPEDAVKPFLPLKERTRIYVDRGDAKERLTIGDRELPAEAAPVVTPECDGAAIKIGDTQVSTYRASATDFAKANPDKKRSMSQASLFIALDPAVCYQYNVKQYGQASVVNADTSTVLRGGAAHVIDSDEVEFFLQPAPATVTEDAALTSVFMDEIVRAPCPAK